MHREKVSHPCFVLCKSEQAAHATQRANFPPCCGLLGIEDVVRVRVVAQQRKVLSARPATGSSPHRARMVSCTLMLPRWRRVPVQVPARWCSTAMLRFLGLQLETTQQVL